MNFLCPFLSSDQFIFNGTFVSLYIREIPEDLLPTMGFGKRGRKS